MSENALHRQFVSNVLLGKQRDGGRELIKAIVESSLESFLAAYLNKTHQGLYSVRPVRITRTSASLIRIEETQDTSNGLNIRFEITFPYRPSELSRIDAVGPSLIENDSMDTDLYCVLCVDINFSSHRDIEVKQLDGRSDFRGWRDRIIRERLLRDGQLKQPFKLLFVGGAFKSAFYEAPSKEKSYPAGGTYRVLPIEVIQEAPALLNSIVKILEKTRKARTASEPRASDSIGHRENSANTSVIADDGDDEYAGGRGTLYDKFGNEHEVNDYGDNLHFDSFEEHEEYFDSYDP